MTKHDDELRAMRRRWRELHDRPDLFAEVDQNLGGVSAELYEYWQATYDLAKAYYEQFASDDEAPADDAWLEALAESVNARPSVMLWYVRSTSSSFWQLEHTGPFGHMQIVPLQIDMTRGQVRRLLGAMGVEVRQ